LFGRRNVGKSSLLNALTAQQVSIVSPEAGTTTDPVEKPMELLPIGPVLFIDTAGVDDDGALGAQRVARTRAVLDRVDVGVLVAEAGRWGAFEAALLRELGERDVPVVVAFNKADLAEVEPALVARVEAARVRVVQTVACRGGGDRRVSRRGGSTRCAMPCGRPRHGSCSRSARSSPTSCRAGP